MGTAVLSRLGVTTAELAPMDRAVQIDGDLERARALVPPAMLAIGIAGSARDLLPRLEGLVAAGARHLSFGPPLGPDPLQAIETLGSRVLPHLR